MYYFSSNQFTSIIVSMLQNVSIMQQIRFSYKATLQKKRTMSSSLVLVWQCQCSLSHNITVYLVSFEPQPQQGIVLLNIIYILTVHCHSYAVFCIYCKLVVRKYTKISSTIAPYHMGYDQNCSCHLNSFHLHSFSFTHMPWSHMLLCSLVFSLGSWLI